MSYPAKELIKKRKSVRTFNGRPLSAEHLKALEAHIDSQENPFGVPENTHYIISYERAD